jgi:thiamine biosynthesis lipoprotein ApbE
MFQRRETKDEKSLVASRLPYAPVLSDCFLWIEDPLAAIDLGGIAKGYLADRLIEVLSA